LILIQTKKILGFKFVASLSLGLVLFLIGCNSDHRKTKARSVIYQTETIADQCNSSLERWNLSTSFLSVRTEPKQLDLEIGFADSTVFFDVATNKIIAQTLLYENRKALSSVENCAVKMIFLQFNDTIEFTFNKAELKQIDKQFSEKHYYSNVDYTLSNIDYFDLVNFESLAKYVIKETSIHYDFIDYWDLFRDFTLYLNDKEKQSDKIEAAKVYELSIYLLRNAGYEGTDPDHYKRYAPILESYGLDPNSLDKDPNITEYLKK